MTLYDTWTDPKRVEYLKTEWEKQEKSAGIIAKELGVSRSAVIGKARRLKLTKREPRKPALIQDPNGRMAQRRYGNQRIKMQPRQRPTKPTPPSVPVIKPDKQPTKGPRGGVTLLGLTSNMCRWPIADGKFCGAELPPNRHRYCPEYCTPHIKRATVPSGPHSSASVKRWRHW